ncbi:sensor histidine kinase [Methylomonas methanica]|uniref:histidine kinase n=1 Tax=Methylomonas methanica (strain DSM 25384 / MC09) TaxID=857087 RepID=G0A4C8_METMM|nr:HAMP domain-containing sensor histidine kinase [Methylomonas methanica]AEG00344.1 integral membrane sensor signal transduction histidine kinase [Methylomonas methanica MC09]
MKRLIKTLNRFDFRQRYDLVVLISVAMAGMLIIASLYVAAYQYASDYTRQYWKTYTLTFANSVKYSVILHATSISQDIIQTYAGDSNVLKASVFESPHTLIASSTQKAFACPSTDTPVLKTQVKNTAYVWCFYTPLYQDDDYLGYVELVVSKQDLDAFMRQIFVMSGLIVMIVLIILFLLVRRFSGIFTAPLFEIVTALTNVSLGIRGHRVNFKGPPDMQRMGADFNDMLAKIERNEQILEQCVTDRTNELKIALDSSRAANHYKNQIMTLVSHEMKTPLHSIGAYLELIQAALPKTAEFDLCRSFHANALARTQDLNELINKVLIHGKLEASKVELNQTSVDIQTLMTQCAAKLKPALVGNRNRLSLAGEPGMITIDTEVLRHIVDNLLSNACKFTVEGDIQLSWRYENEALIIQIRDSGCGIPPEYQSLIFEPFWQADMSLTREHGGHGLGLSITKRFIELLGGSISVFSEPGKGALFTVKIPWQ